jgi:predicted nucleotidyltransferase component of viral defense system
MLKKQKELLDKFSNEEIFNNFYFVGGTAIAYYLNHRISYDLDFLSLNKLEPFKLKALSIKFNANYIPDINAAKFKINTGEEIEKYKMMFNFNGIKVEFFYPNNDIITNIIKNSEIQLIKEKIKTFPLQTLAKLKLIAFFNRNKLRDLFDVYVLLDKKIINIDDIDKITSIYTDKTFIEFLEDFKDDGIESLDFDKKNEYYVKFYKKNNLNFIKKELKKLYIGRIKNENGRV